MYWPFLPNDSINLTLAQWVSVKNEAKNEFGIKMNVNKMLIL